MILCGVQKGILIGYYGNQRKIHVRKPKKYTKLLFRNSKESSSHSNSIHGLGSIEFGNRTKSNTKLCVSSISEPIELNRTQSIRLCWTEFNSIEHSHRERNNTNPTALSLKQSISLCLRRIPQPTLNHNSRLRERERPIMPRLLRISKMAAPPYLTQ